MKVTRERKQNWQATNETDLRKRHVVFLVVDNGQAQRKTNGISKGIGKYTHPFLPSTLFIII